MLKVRGLTKRFPVAHGMFASRLGAHVTAVDDASFDVAAGETLGVVGESGCGKSTLARMLVRLERPTAGSVEFEGGDVGGMRGRDLKAFRRHAQIVFQDPYSSLDPRMTIEESLAEPFAIHRVGSRSERVERVGELLETVGLPPDHAGRYPHECSGGQRQRVGVARALALRPKLLVCDEPVSALDVSVRAQVIDLLRRVQRESGLTYVFIAHDLSVVRDVSDRVAVMHLGRIVEIASRRRVYEAPNHPYTQALLSAVPVPDPERERGRERIVLSGDMPSVTEPLTGCAFRTRCPIARSVCRERAPELLEVGDGHRVACHFATPFPVPRQRRQGEAV